jgi:hypothetical protein
VQTPVVIVGRLTIDRIDPHGSLGALGVAETDGEGAGDGAACSCAALFETTNTHATTAAAMQARPLCTKRVRFLAVQEDIEPLFLTYGFDFNRRDEVDQPQHGIGEDECPCAANNRCGQLLS